MVQDVSDAPSQPEGAVMSHTEMLQVRISILHEVYSYLHLTLLPAYNQ